MNWLFGTQATMSGFEGTIIKGTDVYPFDTVSHADLVANESFASLLYGANWENEMSSGDSGSYNLFNGALTQFADGNNVLMYAMMSGGEQIDPTNYTDYLFGGTPASS